MSNHEALENAVKDACDSLAQLRSLVEPISLNWPPIKNEFLPDSYPPFNRFEWLKDANANALNTLYNLMAENISAEQAGEEFVSRWNKRGKKEVELFRAYVTDLENSHYISFSDDRDVHASIAKQMLDLLSIFEADMQKIADILSPEHDKGQSQVRS
jgi:hypothetical protein